MRINKLLSNKGICSRKQAKQLIEEQRISVNGELCIQGQWVTEDDVILLDGKPLPDKEKVYILLNKPRGIICTLDANKENNIINYMNYEDYIFPVGRLDKESEGLIILTNDGDLANQILDSNHQHEKEYRVTVDRSIDEAFLRKMSNGLLIDGVMTRKCKVTKVEDKVFLITLTQGLNRQIRKMVKACGCNVTELQRIRILNIEIGDLPYGEWRHITLEELKGLRKQL